MAGLFVGSYVIGWLSDNIGRKVKICFIIYFP